MANPYESQSASNYNSSPPPDDGSQTSSNLITWSGIKTKLADPLKAYIDAVNTAVLAAFGSLFLNSSNAQSATYDLQADDKGALLKLSNTITLNLLAAATAGDGFAFTPKNTGTGTVTIDGSGSETIDGATTYDLGPNESAVLVCDGSNWQVAATANRLTFTSKDASGATGPKLILDRNSASPAASDFLGDVVYRGRDSGGNNVDYIEVYGILDDPTDASEDSSLRVWTFVAGTGADRLKIGAGVTVGAATGGDKGANSINSSTYYQNGVQVFGAHAWVTFTGSTGAVVASSGVASVTRNSAGNWTVTWTTAFSSTSYGVVATNAGNTTGSCQVKSYATGSCVVGGFLTDGTNAASDLGTIMVVAYGS